MCKKNLFPLYMILFLYFHCHYTTVLYSLYYIPSQVTKPPAGVQVFFESFDNYQS